MSFTCILVQNEPNEIPLRKGPWPFSFERSATFPPQADPVLVDLLSSVVARGGGGGPCGRSPPTRWVLSTLPLLTPQCQSWRKSGECSCNTVTAEVPWRQVLGFTHHILCYLGCQAQSPPCCPTFMDRLCYAFHVHCPAQPR